MSAHKSITLAIAVVVTINTALASCAGEIRPAVEFSVRDGSQINPTNGAYALVCGGCQLFANDAESNDEGFVEFSLPDIRHGRVFLEFWIRDLVQGSDEPRQFLSLAAYVGDGVAGLGDYGIGDLYVSQLVYDQPFPTNSLGEYVALDVTRLVDELANEQASHIGFRFYDSRHETPPPPPIQAFVPQLQIYDPVLRMIPEPSGLGILLIFGSWFFMRTRFA